jgi:mRNA interferase MazF
VVTPSAGEVITVRFPFSDLSSSKLRPAVVLANSGRGDWILCQITSKSYADASAIQIKEQDFASGPLHITSYARPGKIFTANESLMVTQVGKLKVDCFHIVVNAIIQLLQSQMPTDSLNE